MKTKNHDAYRVVALINNKPAGFVGLYRQKDNAVKAASKSRVPCRITRVRNVMDTEIDDAEAPQTGEQ